jgi:hypothetical protein
MNNEANRLLITFFAAAVIVLMAVVIFFTWTADTDVIDRVGDLEEYLAEHNDDAGKLIVTLAALVVVVLAFLLIILELAPEDEERELRVKQAGAVTIVPASALRQRLEEALIARPEITAARARVSTGDKGIATALNLTVDPRANIAAVSQEAVRVAVDTIQNDLGLPVQGVPTVRVALADGKDGKTKRVEPASPPVAASSVMQPPVREGEGVSPPPTYGSSTVDADADSLAAAEGAPGPDEGEPMAAEVSGPPMPLDEPQAEPLPGGSPSEPSAEESLEGDVSSEGQAPTEGEPAPTEGEATPGSEAAPAEDESPREAGSGPPSPGLSRDPWRQP